MNEKNNSWAADITNDPDDDFNLYIEILYNDKHVGNIKKINEELNLTIYNGEKLTIPCKWISEVIKQAFDEL